MRIWLSSAFCALVVGGLVRGADIDVRDCGAIGDGGADDTAAFGEAVAQAGKARARVYVPRGTYRLTDTIELNGICLTGPARAAWPADIDAMPSVHFEGSKGTAFRLGAGAALSNIDITVDWEKEPETGAATVEISGIGVYISNVRIRYPWNGIATDGRNNVGRLNLENVFMVSPRNIGVIVNGTWDVPCLRNVEVWNMGAAKGNRGMKEGIGFLLLKNDLIRLSDCFVFGMHRGYVLAETHEDHEIKGPTWGVMNGCATDYCVGGIEVRGNHTLSVVGGLFWDHGFGLSIDGEKAIISMTGCDLKSNDAPSVVVRNSAQAVVTGCTLRRPMPEHPGPAARVSGGSLNLSNSSIWSTGSAAVVEESARSVIIQGNLIQSAADVPLIIEAPKTNVAVSTNLVKPLPLSNQ